ncbi:MAG: IclR family transcriptional regulator [Campylobacteraceae bacterium]|nr:IclR family transcriptional regulator [Campylobacteraceae bacterium]
MIKENKKKNLSSVGNALRILNCFSLEKPEQRVTELAIELNIGKSTVSRLLTTLANEGFVRKDKETQKYSLGFKILTLYNTLTTNLEIIKEARPFLEKLFEETSESIQIAELEDLHVIYTDQIKSRHPVHILAHIGRINPIHCTSSGKLLLAYQTKQTINELLSKELVAYTPYTIVQPQILLEELAVIKKEGYCININEFIEGVISISASIKDYKGDVIAAISIVGPTQRINGGKVVSYLNKLLSAAKEISKNLGYAL